MTQALKGVPEHSGKLMRILLAALIALTLIPASALLAPDEAYGVEIPNVGDTYYGSCYIEDTWYVGDESHFNVSSFSGELAGCWATGSWKCANPSAAAPTYVGATYVATVSAVNVSEGWVEYYIYITPPGATNGIDRDPATGWLYGYQHVDGHARVAKDFGGYIELFKTSANPSISDGNACYSFEGGVFYVYDSNGTHVSTMTTNKDGWAKTTDRLSFGWYNVKEVTPPKGYALDTSDHWVEITAANDATVQLHVTDYPQGDPAMVAVGKIDKDTTSALPQGDTSLAGAEFSVQYFDGYYKTEAEAMASGTPTRTWVLKTDENGEARLRDSYLVSGSDALYKNSYGDATIPLGTVVVKETKAPKDYVLPNPVPVSVQQVTSDGVLENVTTYNTPKITDVVKRGDIAITKAYDDSPDEDTGTMVPEADITFDFYASHQFSGTTPKDDVKPAFSLVTDENGYADTSAIYIIENEDGTYKERPRKSDDAGALPHDTYLMVQRTAIDGYERLDPMLIYVDENGKTYNYLLQNGTIRTPLKVVKVDSETGEVVPYPASWQIIDVKTGAPISMTTYYPVVETFDVFTSDAQGRLTLPEKLPSGDYELQEVLAPADNGTGYLINPVNVAFSTQDGYDWDTPLTITFADAPAKGRIEIMKTDEYTGVAVPAATYVIQAIGDIYTLDGTLRAKDGEIVDTITTDETGYAASKELYLGRYDVVEAISPEGFALDTTRHGVTLEYADQTIPVVTHLLELIETPTTLKLAKIDSLTGEPMADVSFLVVNEDAEFEEVLVTDEQGLADASYLPHGAYSMTEIETPFGYASNPEIYSFEIDDQGLIEGKAIYTIEVENQPIQVKISKVDVTSAEELPGCQLEIYAADEEGNAVDEALYSWESGDTAYEIIGGLEPGDYILRETYPAPGYVTAEEILFTVEDDGEIQTVLMIDDFTKVEISKRDITTQDELPGALLEIYEVDEDGNKTDEPIHSWTSTDEPHLIEYLEVGDYILHEDTAPLGYELAQDIEFSVEDTGEVQTVVMYDELTPGTPGTPDGGKGYDKTGFDATPLIVLGLILLAGGMLGLGIAYKRHHRRVLEQDEAGEFDIPRGEDISEDDEFFKE